MERYTPKERNRILEWLSSESRQWPQFVGCVLVGSGAAGFTDQFSDIDIVLVTDPALEFDEISEQWKRHLMSELAVLAYACTPRGERVILHNFYLRNYLEINNSILPLDHLVARQAHYKVLWDKSGRIQEIMDETWSVQQAKNPLEDYLIERKASIWHWINHAYVALCRGKEWQALSDIEALRYQVITLRAYRKGLRPRRNRDVDLLDQVFKDKVSELLVDSLTIGTLLEKLRFAMALIFEELKETSAELDVEYGLEEVEAALWELVGRE